MKAKHIPLGLALLLFLTIAFLSFQALTFPFNDVASKKWIHSELAANLGYAYGHFCYERLESFQAAFGLTVDYQHLLGWRLWVAMLTVAIALSTLVWLVGSLIATAARKHRTRRRWQARFRHELIDFPDSNP